MWHKSSEFGDTTVKTKASGYFQKQHEIIYGVFSKSSGYFRYRVNSIMPKMAVLIPVAYVRF